MSSVWKSTKYLRRHSMTFQLTFNASIVWVLSCIVESDSATPWTGAHQAPLLMGFPRQEYWTGLPFPPPGHLSHPGIELKSLVSSALARGYLPLRHLGSPFPIFTHTQILGMKMRKRKIGVVKEVLCPVKQRVEKLKKIIYTAVGLQTDEHILLGS